MYPLKSSIVLLFTLCVFSSHAQTWLKDYPDPYDTVWENNPVSATFTDGHGALFTSSLWGSAGTSLMAYTYQYAVKINNYGDTVWTKRNPMDTTFLLSSLLGARGVLLLGGSDTVNFMGVTQSVIRLSGNGHYVMAAYNFGATPPCYELKQFDSSGNFISSHIIIDTTKLDRQDIKLIASSSNNFYLIYGTDSFFLIDTSGGLGIGYDSNLTRTYVQKLDQNYNVLWARDFTYGINISTGMGYSWPDALWIDNIVPTQDGGLAILKISDTGRTTYGSYFGTWMQNESVLKLRSDGSTQWNININSLIGSSYPNSTMIIIPTHDSGMVVPIMVYDSVSHVNKLLKLDYNGNITDSMHFATDTAAVNQGIELSTGKLLFTSSYTPGFSFYDIHLNYLYSVPYPFIENASEILIPNQMGGAFCTAMGGNPVYMPDWHMVALNFDSLFNTYPSVVTGNVYQDNNHDCIDNSGDLTLGGSVIKLHETTLGVDYYGFAGDTGSYACNVPYGTYTVSHPTYRFERNECGGYTLPISTSTTFPNNNFADTLVPGIQDLILWVASACIVPGDTTGLMALAYNNGSVSVDTTMDITLDANVNFVSSTPAPTSVSGHVLTYHLNLLSDSIMYINIVATVSTSLVLGDTVTFTATSPFPDNVVVTNDSSIYQRVVVSAYDPNYVSVNQPKFFHRNNTMVFTVNFQNTGNYRAKNIVVIDTLDSKLDPSTFKFLNTSAPSHTVSWMAGNRLYFSLKNINLPDSASNPLGSHGWFSYSMNVKNTVPLGDTIHATANIFFDYNPGVVTNTTTNILAEATFVNKVPEFPIADKIRIYPNPSQGKMTLDIPNTGEQWNISITDIEGRLVKTYPALNQKTIIELNVAPGLYLLKLEGINSHQRVTKKVSVVE